MRRVAAWTASTSLPSTDTASSPNPRARSLSGPAYCLLAGVEIAHPLFWQKNTMGADVTAAQFSASLASPWLDAPSPKQVNTTLSVASYRTPIA